jgi:TPR repeat protein
MILELPGCVTRDSSSSVQAGSPTQASAAERLRAVKEAYARGDYKRAQELYAPAMPGKTLARPATSVGDLPGQLGITNRHILAAQQAINRGDYATAMENYKQIDADEGAIKADVASTYRTSAPTDINSQNRIDAIRGQLDDLVYARTRIGMSYETGQGAPQDYAAARSWYAKAMSTRNYKGEFPLGGPATMNLAFLVANGLGGPKDVATAKEMFVVMGVHGADFALLLDHGMLPRSRDEATDSYVRTAKSRIAAAEQARAAAEQAQYERTHPPQPAGYGSVRRTSESGPGLATCIMMANRSFAFRAFAGC